MSTQQCGLVVDPVSLELEFIPNQPLPAQFSLQNPTKDRIAFTIKPNHPSRYYIKNQSGYVDPGEKFQVDIHMHASQEIPKNSSTDKFMVQFMAVGQGESLITPEMFAKELVHVKNVEVGVVFKQQEQDVIKVEKSSQSRTELLKDLPTSSQEERRTLFSRKLQNDKDAQKITTNLEQEKSGQNKSKDQHIYIEMGKQFQVAEEGGQNPPEIIKQSQGKNEKSYKTGEIQQDSVQNQGDSSSSSAENNDAENAVKIGNQRIYIQDTIRERVKSSSEFITEFLQRDLTSGRVFLTFPLDLLFPRAIRAYSAQICQILLGIIIFISAFIYFWWLFVQFNECDTQVIETPGIPKNANWCKPRFIDNTEIKALNLEGIWEGDSKYNARNAGPWQFKFDAFQADKTTFLSNINNLLEKANIFVESLQNKTFIETLGAALFFSAKENGTFGTVELTANIDLEMIFDNYKYSKFSFINLQQELLYSVNQNLGARIVYEQQLPVQNCRGELRQTGDNKYFCQKLINEGSPKITSEMGDLTYTAPPITYFDVFKQMFFPNVQQYQRWADRIRNVSSVSSESVIDILAYPKEPFISQFNIQEAFVYNYCNSDGREYCLEAMGKVMEQDELDDFFYTWIPGFWGELASNINELSQLGQRFGVAKYEIYINSIDMFGIYVGQKQVLPEKGGPNTVYALVMVPQLVQFDFQNGEMICRSCLESATQLNTTNCQKNIQVVLHLYAFPMSDYFKKFAQKNLTAQETIQQFYVTSFIHGLESWLRSNRNARIFRDDASTPDSSDFQNYNFFFNQKFASVNDLHCEGSSQWAFKQDIKFEIPFLLETGINSCEVKNCPGWLKSLGDAWANVELAYLIIILILSIIILLVLFKISGGQGDGEEGVLSFRETLAAFIDQIRNQ